MFRITTTALLTLVFCHNGFSQPISGYRETLSGAGPYSPVGGGLVGFEDPDWHTNTTGHFDGDGGLQIGDSGKEYFRHYFHDSEYQGRTSFRQRYELKNVDLGVPIHSGAIDGFDGRRYSGQISAGGGGALGTLIFISKFWQEFDDSERTTIHDTSDLERIDIELGNDLTMEVTYDDKMYELSYLIETGGQASTFGPFLLLGRGLGYIFTDPWTTLNFSLEARATIDLMELYSFEDVPGDFTSDEIVNAADIDRLSNAIATNYQNVGFDLNGDTEITEADRTILVQDILNTYFGDSNLDGEFNSADLVNIFAAGEYEDAIERNSTWATGDWSGNGEFDSADLVLAFQDGGYELGPREAVRSVPEPNASGVAVSFGFLIGSLVRRRQR